MLVKQIKNNDGFTLVELLVAAAMFLLILAASSNVFLNILNQFKQQSRIAETNIEGAVSLEMLKRDMDSAGYGIPWNVTGEVTTWASLTNYFEAASNTTLRIPNPASYNNGDAGTGTGGSAPRAIFTGNNVTTYSNGNAIFNGSDYLVIRSMIVPRTAVVQRWTRLQKNNVKRDDLSGDSFTNNDGVIVLSAGTTDTTSRALVVNGGAYAVAYNSPANSTLPFAPPDMTEMRIIYGVNSNATLRMPFNRADYFIRRENSVGTSITPSGCAPNTGVLTKAVIDHATGDMTDYPILDCVADMQIVFRRDTNNDGVTDDTIDDLSGLTAQQVREQVKEVRVYILAQEGQKDSGYTYPSATINISDPDKGILRTYDLGTNRNYRWKIYTLAIKLNNLWGK